MSDEKSEIRDDAKRLCPVCRTPISVWATKCRACGEKIGRPREEEVKLTIRDLGGETKGSYTVSSNVTDAMSAFLAEEQSLANTDKDKKAGGQKGAWFKKKNQGKGEGGQGTAETDMVELDAYHKELAAAVMGDAIEADAKRKAEKEAEPVLRRKITAWLSISVGLILFCLAAVWVNTQVRNYIEERNRPPEIQDTNRAEAILLQEEEAGEVPLRALTEACRAYGVKPVEENVAILEKMEIRFKAGILKMLEADPWTRDILNDASRLSADASKLENVPESISRLYQEVLADINAYAIRLVSIQKNEETRETEATFDVTGAGFVKQLDNGKEVPATTITCIASLGTTSKLPNKVGDRFYVRQIARSVGNIHSATQMDIPEGGFVKLADLKRNGRKLIIKEGSVLEPDE